MAQNTTSTDETADRAVMARTVGTPYVRMTQKDRFHEFWGHLFGRLSILRAAPGAGILQAVNRPGEWGFGAQGYGLRYANAHGQTVVRSTLMYGLSNALDVDNRYSGSGSTGVWLRLQYAVASTFEGRHDDGSRHLSISRVSSTIATGFLSRAWQPPGTSSARDGVIQAQVGFNGREFLPFHFLHSHPPVTAVASQDAAH
jgi:hypothetical protein